MFIVDTHCDTLHGMLLKKEDFAENSLQIDYKKLNNTTNEGILQFFAVFESPSNTMEIQKKDIRNMIDLYKNLTSEFNLNTVLSKNDLNKNGISTLLSLEGLYFMEGEVSQLEGLYENGVRCISLTWNPDNEFSGGVSGISGSGLTDKGNELAEKAVSLGILLDVSHITDKGFWDIKNIVDKHNKPFIASHSNARKLCGHKRNLSDSMLKGLAESGGVSGINMFSCFLNDDCTTDSEDVIRHIEYICSLTGPEFVGFGSDFDGIEREKSALTGPEAFSDVIEQLLRLNYKESDVRNIAGGNFLRVLEEVLV